MRKLTHIEGYIGRLQRTTTYLQSHLTRSTIEYVHGFITNLPENFDNSPRWKQMNWNDYNYRHGLHNSFAGLLGELYAEAAWTQDGGEVQQLFADKEAQVKQDCDQIIMYNGAKLFNQCKSARISTHSARGDCIVAYERMFNIPVYPNYCLTIIDVDRKTTIAISSKQFVDALPECNTFGDEIWVSLDLIGQYISIRNFQETIIGAHKV